MRLILVLYILISLSSAWGGESAFFESSKSELKNDIHVNWAHDPFVQTPGYVKSEKEKYNFSIEAIVYDGDDSIVVIDGEQYFKGSLLAGGYQVIHIGTNYTIIDNGKVTRELQLPVVNNEVQSFIRALSSEDEE